MYVSKFTISRVVVDKTYRLYTYFWCNFNSLSDRSVNINSYRIFWLLLQCLEQNFSTLKLHNVTSTWCYIMVFSLLFMHPTVLCNAWAHSWKLYPPFRGFLQRTPLGNTQKGSIKLPARSQNPLNFSQEESFSVNMLIIGCCQHWNILKCVKTRVPEKNTTKSPQCHWLLRNHGWGMASSIPSYPV